MTGMRRRFPDYDVLAKGDTPSWNEATRRVIDERLQICDKPQFFTDDEWLTLRAVCHRIVPQPPGRTRPIPVAAMIDRKLYRRGRRLPSGADAGDAGGLAARAGGAR